MSAREAGAAPGQAARIEGECTVCGGQNGNHSDWCGHARNGGDRR